MKKLLLIGLILSGLQVCAMHKGLSFGNERDDVELAVLCEGFERSHVAEKGEDGIDYVAVKVRHLDDERALDRAPCPVAKNLKWGGLIERSHDLLLREEGSQAAVTAHRARKKRQRVGKKQKQVTRKKHDRRKQQVIKGMHALGIIVEGDKEE